MSKLFYSEIPMAAAKPSISIDYTQEAVVVTLMDEKILDAAQISDLEESILPLAGESQGKSLVIDFSNVGFLSSSVLGLLIRLSKRVNETNGQLKLCSLKKQIAEIFRITRLNKIFDIFDDIEAAMKK